MPGRLRNLLSKLFKPKSDVKSVFGKANEVAGSKVVKVISEAPVIPTRVKPKQIKPPMVIKAKGSAVNYNYRKKNVPIGKGSTLRGK